MTRGCFDSAPQSEVEWSGETQRQEACACGSMSGAASNYSLDASGMRLIFIENLNQFPDASRRVNSALDGSLVATGRNIDEHHPDYDRQFANIL